jgi:hypothetical protein
LYGLDSTLDGCVDHQEGIADAQDRRPRPDPVPERAAQHATARAGLGEAAPQRRGRHALPARALTQSSLIAPSSRASASSGAFSPRNTAYPLHEPAELAAFEALLSKCIVEALVAQLRKEAEAHGGDVVTWLMRDKSTDE